GDVSSASSLDLSYAARSLQQIAPQRAERDRKRQFEGPRGEGRAWGASNSAQQVTRGESPLTECKRIGGRHEEQTAQLATPHFGANRQIGPLSRGRAGHLRHQEFVLFLAATKGAR